jgi:hypothetical protein
LFWLAELLALDDVLGVVAPAMAVEFVELCAIELPVLTVIVGSTVTSMIGTAPVLAVVVAVESAAGVVLEVATCLVAWWLTTTFACFSTVTCCTCTGTSRTMAWCAIAWWPVESTTRPSRPSSVRAKQTFRRDFFSSFLLATSWLDMTPPDRKASILGLRTVRDLFDARTSPGPRDVGLSWIGGCCRTLEKSRDFA